MNQEVVNRNLEDLRNAINTTSAEDGNQISGISESNEESNDIVREIIQVTDNNRLYRLSSYERINDYFENDKRLSIDSIVASLNKDQVNGVIDGYDIIDILKDYFQTTCYDAFDFSKKYTQTNYVDFIREYFSNGIDCIKEEKLEVKVNALFTNDVALCELEEPTFIKGNIGIFEDGEKPFEESYKFSNLMEPITHSNNTLNNPNKYFPYLLKTKDPVQVESVDFIYSSNTNIVTFRVIQNRIQIIYNASVRAEFIFITLFNINAEMPLKYLLSGEVNKYAEAALVASTLNAKNAVYSPADNIFDTMRIAGMTKYEQYGYLCKYLPTIETISDLYPRVNYQLLNKFKDGIPDEVCEAFYLDKENRVESLRDGIESIKELIAESEDVKLISMYSTCRLFLDIVDEEIFCGAFTESRLMSRSYSFGYYAEAIFKLMKSKHLKSFDEVISFMQSNGIEISDKKDNFKLLANAKEYYRILAYYTEYASKFLFVKTIVREPSFAASHEQYDLGFIADAIQIRPGTIKTNVSDKMKFVDLTNLLNYVKEGFQEAVKQDTRIPDIEKEIIALNAHIAGYYLIKALYYQLTDKVQPRDNSLNCVLGSVDKNSGTAYVTLKLGKIDFPIVDLDITYKVPYELLMKGIEQIQNNIITSNNYIGITDYLKLQYKYGKSIIMPEFVVANANIDYHRIIPKEKYFTVTSQSIMDQSKQQTLLSSNLFLLGKEALTPIRYFESAKVTPYENLDPEQMEAVDVINDVMSGISVPGFTKGIVPPTVIYYLFARQMVTDKKAYDHTPTCFDLYNKDMVTAIDYEIVEQNEACSYEEKAGRKDIAFAEFEYPKFATITRENIMRNIIDYSNISIDALLEYIKKDLYIVRLNKFSVYYENDILVLFDPSLLDKIGLKINDNSYIVKLGVDTELITLKEEINV